MKLRYSRLSSNLILFILNAYMSMNAYHAMLQSPLHPHNIRDFGDIRVQAPLTQKLSRADELRKQVRDNRELMLKFYRGGHRYQAMQQYRSVVYLRKLLSGVAND